MICPRLHYLKLEKQNPQSQYNLRLESLQEMMKVEWIQISLIKRLNLNRKLMKFTQENGEARV